MLQRSVYHTELGQNINLDANVVYVSWDDKKTWLALHDFADRVCKSILFEFIKAYPKLEHFWRSLLFIIPIEYIGFLLDPLWASPEVSWSANGSYMKANSK